MLELLAPAGSPEAVVAAVQNGADSIYLGLDSFNARRSAKNFTEETLGPATEYCRVRGVKVYVALNVLTTDRDIILAERVAKTVSRLGADALIIQDPGLIRVLRQAVPDMPIHASTQMSVHSIDGVRKAAEMGASRVVLARELSLPHIAYICKLSPIEIEVFAHGALCMCYSGQCYMSAMLGGRSGNRGLCAQPCRLPYSVGGITGAHLSLKDACLVDHLADLERAGVKSLKIEGRMKRPEYTAIATQVYANAIREERAPTEKEIRLLTAVFSREGFTDAYLNGEKGPEMFGIRTEANKQESKSFGEIKRAYLNAEIQRVPVRFYAMIKGGQRAKLAVSDERGHIIKTEGPRPEQAEFHELSHAQIETQLCKTGGTPYLCQDIQVVLDPGLNLASAELNKMRRDLLEELTIQRAEPTPRSEGIFRPGDPPPRRTDPPQLNVAFHRLSQLSDEIADMGPSLIYLPLDEILSGGRALKSYLERDQLTFSAVLPPVIWDDERDAVKQQLEQVQALGITQCLAANLGHIDLAKRAGMLVRGDFGLNVFNSQTLETLKEFGLASATASFELNLAQIRDMDKAIDLELIVYGRLPLMITENCVISNAKERCACDAPASLSDRKGASFPILKAPGCRNVILNSRKLFLADRAADYMDIGLWGARLSFTTENALECRQVLERYLGLGSYQPGEYTRGRYYKGVE